MKVRKGQVSATRRGAVLGGDLVGDWHEAFDGLLRLGVLRRDTDAAHLVAAARVLDTHTAAVEMDL